MKISSKSYPIDIIISILWSFLLMGGYLKQTAKRMDRNTGKMYYTLSIPNNETVETAAASALHKSKKKNTKPNSWKEESKI